MGYAIDNTERHNGWRNYETWRVYLEVFDGLDIREHFPTAPAPRELAEWASDYADNAVTNFGELDGLAVDYARAFLQRVDWREVADHLQSYAEDCASAEAY
jgi:hypothetical protein